VKSGGIYRGEVAYMLDKVENGLKLLFKLSPNVWYYAQTVGALLHNGFRVVDRMFSIIPLRTFGGPPIECLARS
jgi:hypothetical protein